MSAVREKTRVVWVGNNIIGMKAVVALVPDEGLLEAKRYLEAVHGAMARRETVECVPPVAKTVEDVVCAGGLDAPPLFKE